MPFFAVIRCPTNGEILASFNNWMAYHYRLENGIEFPLDVTYAWCHRCECFVECERLYPVDEIKDRIAELESRRSHWSDIDARHEELFTEIGRRLPKDRTQHALHAIWSAALEWRHSRKSPPRCLQCASFFAISMLAECGAVRHPAGTCMVEVRIGAQPLTEGFADHVFFSAEGVRVAQLSYDDYVKRREQTPT